MILKIISITDRKVCVVQKYSLDMEGKQHIWSNDWYGHHIIGVDCEWFIVDNEIEEAREITIKIIKKLE